MLTLTCSGCHEKLSVKEDGAGKKVKCPSCGQITHAPSDTVAVEPAKKPSFWDEPSNPFLSESGEVDLGAEEVSLTDFLAPPQEPDELGRLGKYRILEVLGHGAMGVVYKAEDPKLGRLVAVKAMLPKLAASATAAKRFLREAQTLAAFEHDHIVRLYDVGEDPVPYFAMEFLKGEPLDKRLDREGMLPLSEAMRIGREIAQGLAAAHEKGLIHRDIKPGNIWLEAGKNRVKIVDFGLARSVSVDSALTVQGTVMGTPAYMSPEQGRGETTDARTDLWSLGVVLYRLCTGRQPFRGQDTLSTLMSTTLDDPPPPCLVNDVVPVPLSDLILQLLVKDAAGRLAKADLVVEQIRALESGASSSAITAPTTAVPTASRDDTVAFDSRPPGATQLPAPRRSLLPIVIALVALGILSLLVLAGLFLFWGR